MILGEVWTRHSGVHSSNAPLVFWFHQVHLSRRDGLRRRGTESKRAPTCPCTSAANPRRRTPTSKRASQVWCPRHTTLASTSRRRERTRGRCTPPCRGQLGSPCVPCSRRPRAKCAGSSVSPRFPGRPFRVGRLFRNPSPPPRAQRATLHGAGHWGRAKSARNSAPCQLNRAIPHAPPLSHGRRTSPHRHRAPRARGPPCMLRCEGPIHSVVSVPHVVARALSVVTRVGRGP